MMDIRDAKRLVRELIKLNRKELEHGLIHNRTRVSYKRELINQLEEWAQDDRPTPAADWPIRPEDG